VISVLLPSRGRPAALAASVDSLKRLAARPEGVEILIAADPDDPPTWQAAQNECRDASLWIASERHGYHQLHAYVNQLAGQARGEWLMLWNDDARMLTPGWDDLVHQQPTGVLWPQSNDVAGCNTFPIWPTAWTRELGYVSLSPHCDSWIQHLGTELGLHDRIPVEILHDRADLTGGHDDQTRAESQAGYRTADYHSPTMQAVRQRDVDTLRALLDRQETPA